jgi:O-methyltransferase
MNQRIVSEPDLSAHASEADRRYLSLLKHSITASLYPESAWRTLGTEEDRQGVVGYVKNIAIKKLAQKNLILVRKMPYASELRETGGDWPMFGYSMVGHRRLDNIESCLRSVVEDNVEGDFVECGVWRGGASMYAKAVLNSLRATDRSVWLADSFQGMPARKEADNDDFDISFYSYLAVSVDEVRGNFERFGLLDENVKFIKGWFSDTLRAAPIRKIAVLRVDGDYYASTMDVLDGLFDRVSNAGYVIIDDYGGWESCRRAVTDFCAKRRISPNIERIDSTGAFWRKT